MNQDLVENINFIVSSVDESCRLDVFIFQMCEQLSSRSYSAKLIKKGLVLVNKKIKKPSYPLKISDNIQIDLSFLRSSEVSLQAEEIPLDILFEDEHILVVNKPYGLVVHPGAGVSKGTLVNALLAHCGSIPSLGDGLRAGIVHRLDRDTSGVMVTAKTQQALSFLSKQFSEHKHFRMYHTVCYGEFEKKQDRIETGHIRDPHNRLKYKSVLLGEGKRAALSYKVLNTLFSHTLSLVECILETGRTHQIRVQMEGLKHPIVGDSLYAQIPGRFQNNKPLISLIKKRVERQLLHACVLEITHPYTKERMSFSAPYPKDFEDFLDAVSDTN